MLFVLLEMEMEVCECFDFDVALACFDVSFERQNLQHVYYTFKLVLVSCCLTLPPNKRDSNLLQPRYTSQTMQNLLKPY